MNRDKRRKLEAAGWRIGAARDLLGLTTREAKLVEITVDRARLRERALDRRAVRNLARKPQLA